MLTYYLYKLFKGKDMAKTGFASLQDVMQDIASQALENAGKEFLGNIEKMGLNIGQKVNISQAFDHVINNAQELASDGVDVVIDFIKDSINKEIEKIDILPEGLKSKISQEGGKIIDKIGNISKEAITQAASAGKEVLGAVFKQTFETIKSVFSNIGAALRGDKTKSEAIKGIKSSWKEAGEKIMETAAKAKKSFVEKVGGRKNQDKTQSHAERVTKSQESPGRSR